MVPSTGYAISSITDLKAINAENRADGYSRLVKSSIDGKPAWYTFVATSVEPGDDNLIIVPDDNPASGRFLKLGHFGGGTKNSVLTADTTWYVDSTNGSDTNNGLTVETAFQTIFKAAIVASSYLNPDNYPKTIRLLDGTHFAGRMPAFQTQSPDDIIFIQGNSSNLNAVQIYSVGLLFSGSGVYRLGYLTINILDSSDCVVVDNAKLQIGDIEFGAATGAHIVGTNRATIEVKGNYNINGNANCHIQLNKYSLLQFNTSPFYALGVGLGGNATSIQTFIKLDSFSYLLAQNISFQANSVTGSKFDISASIVDTNTGNLDLFPGDTPGTLSKNGQYY